MLEICDALKEADYLVTKEQIIQIDYTQKAIDKIF
jgi:hypothetical protein